MGIAKKFSAGAWDKPVPVRVLRFFGIKPHTTSDTIPRHTACEEEIRICDIKDYVDTARADNVLPGELHEDEEAKHFRPAKNEEQEQHLRESTENWLK